MKQGYAFIKAGIFFLFTLIPSTFSFSQGQVLVNTDWSYSYGNNTFYEKSVTKIDNNGNVYTLGSTLRPSGYDIILLALDGDGDSLWLATFDGGLDDIATDMWVNTTTGYVYVVGASVDTSAMDSLDPIIVAFDNGGAELWHTYGSNASVYNDLYTSVATNGSTRLYVGGTIGTPSAGYDYLASAFNFSGSEVGTNTYDYANYNDVVVKTIYDGTYANLIGVSQPTDSTWDYYLKKFKDNGNWTGEYRSYAGTGFAHRPSDAVYKNDHYYVTGSINNPLTGGYDIKTLCLDTMMVVTWEATYNAPDGYDDHGSALQVASNGDVYVTGYVSTNGQNKNAVLIKYDDNGDERFVRTFGSSLNDAGTDVELIDYKVYVGGYTNNASLTTTSYDTSGTLRWQKVAPINTNLYPNLAIDNEDNVIIGTPYSSYVYTEKYSELEVPTDAALDTNDAPLYRENELIICFNPAKVNIGFVNDPGKQFAQIKDVIDSTLITVMSAKVGVDLRTNRESTVIKMFSQATADEVSISRGGHPISIPKFWSTLYVRFPIDLNILEVMDSLNTIPDISYAEINAAFQLMGTNDPLYNSGTTQSSLHYTSTYPDAHINVDSVWTEYEIGQNWVKVGIVDNGILYTHQEFGTADTGQLFFSKIIGGKNYDQPSFPITDLSQSSGHFDHGTAISGILGARRNDSLGIAGIAGGDIGDSSQAGATLADMRVCCYTNGVNTYGYIGAVGSALYDGSVSGSQFYNGLHIMNLSLASTAESPSVTLSKQMAFARHNGVVLVMARGNVSSNSGATDSTQFWPVCQNKELDMISVGASGNDGRALKIGNSNGSGGGSIPYTASGRGMDFLAPGATINVNSSTSTTISSYTAFGGTSSAAAHVSGVAALMLSDFQGKTNFPDNLNMEDVEHILEYTAYNRRLDTSGIYQYEEGWGIINAKKAFDVLQRPYYGILHFTYWANENDMTLLDNEINPSPLITQWSIYANPLGPPNNFTQDPVGQYKIAGTVYHDAFISPTTQILGYWIRNSYSDAWGDYYVGNTSNYIQTNGWTNIKFDYFSSDSAIVSGFIYERMNYLTYMPYDPAQSDVRLSYSVHVYDPSGEIGIDKLADGPTLNVYPNPTQESVNVAINLPSTDDFILEVTDLSGKLVYSIPSRSLPAGINIIPISLQGFADGVYILKMMSPRYTASRKFIKQ